MRFSEVRYPSISAKLYGMYSKKLKKTDLEELIKQNSSKQAVALLKSLNDEFKELEDNPRRIKIKMLLDDMLIKDIQKINRLLNHKDKEMFAKFISIYEIKCIKNVFRKLSSNSTINEPTNEVENWINKLFTRLKGIEKVNDYEDFLQIIKRNSYDSIFKEFGEDINNINIFEVENKLDKMYFEKMMKSASKYNQKLEDMIGKNIDLNNIEWIYRVKKNYQFSQAQLKDVLIPIHYKLRKLDMQKLLNANDEIELIEILKSTYYAKYIDFTNIDDLEQSSDRYLYHLYQKYFRGNIFDISGVYAYIQLIENENNDIMNIVEGIRYQLDRNEIQKKLVR